jgi:hypothetical protein
MMDSWDLSSVILKRMEWEMLMIVPWFVVSYAALPLMRMTYMMMVSKRLASRSDAKDS